MTGTTKPLSSGGVVVYAIDAGSIASGNFAWTSSKDRQVWSPKIEELADSAVDDLNAGARVSLGIECVLFVPCTEEPARLGKARVGECTRETLNKPFSASAAACATMTGLPALSWFLREVRRRAPHARGTTRWTDFTEGKAEVLVWEAFVSGKEKAVPASHHGDALLAVAAFERALQDGAPTTRVTCDGPFSLAGAALLWAGLSDDVTLLHDQPLVLRPVTKVDPVAG